MDGTVGGIVVHIQVGDVEQGLVCVIGHAGEIGLVDSNEATTFSGVASADVEPDFASWAGAASRADVASRFDWRTGATRRRGLAISSMPKLRNASPAPSRAMHRPGGTNHHHDPSSSASLL